MVGTNAATSNANAIRVNGQVVDLRHALVERLVSRYREHTARTQAEQIARMTWTEEAGHRSPGQGSGSRDLGSTPLRGLRLS